MKKWLLPLILTLISHMALSQMKLGLKFSPSLSSNRISSTSDTLEFSTKESDIRFLFGLSADFPIGETYSFSTGLVYAPKRIAYRASSLPSVSSFFVDINQEFRVHYLQVPISLKLFTNEIQPDLKLYFQVGATAEVKIFDEPIDDSTAPIAEFKPIDATVMLGAGVEYSIGLNTVLFGGFSYYRGLLNVIDGSSPLETDVDIRNDLISLDLGLKF